MTQSYFEFTPEQNALFDECLVVINLYAKKHGRAPTHIVVPVKRLREVYLPMPETNTTIGGAKMVPCFTSEFVNCFYDGYI